MVSYYFYHQKIDIIILLKMKRAMIKSFNTHESHYFGEFHTVGKQDKCTSSVTKITR